MARSDFAWVNFDQDFNSSNEIVTRTFAIEGHPTGTGYLLIQVQDVELPGHRILINDQDLPDFDIPPHPHPPDDTDFRQWVTWMDRIPPSFLRQGQNSITIGRRSANFGSGRFRDRLTSVPASKDFFRVANVAIHWREPG